MYGYGRDFDSALELMDQLRRRMDRVFLDYETGFAPEPATGTSPKTNVYDAGSAFVIQADVPGLDEKNLALTLTQGVLTLSGERKSDVPEGYAAYRQERAPFRFSRSFALPAKVDPEKTVATLKDGVLTVTLEKAPEVKPRQISVRVG
jgi:HSP20 family protein